MEALTTVADRLEKPLTDDRDYCVIRLPNDLEVFLAHDPTTPDAGACMNVEVGSMSDEIPGMAHALEHLVLRGTGKYPDEGDFNSYISSHAGFKNASTSATNTNYFFKVVAQPSNGEESSESNPSALRGALDRLAQLAIDPLFHPETLARELHAVDSEYKMKLQDDEKRLWQLDRSTSNPKHPWNHFSVGNLEVLKEEPERRGINVRDALMDFYRRQYSANRIKLCVLGREPIELLKAWVCESFAAIPNRELKPNRWPDEIPLTPEYLGIQYFVKPVKAYRALNFAFPYLDESEMHESQPSSYLNYLLGHKGKGSLLAYIKDKGWATGLSIGTIAISPETHSLYRCRIKLTPEGLKNYKEVVKVFFMYIGLLREQGPQERIFNESKLIDELAFRYMEKNLVTEFTKVIAGRMHKSIPRNSLLGPACLRKFNSELISTALDSLNPANLRLTVLSPEGTWDQKEKYYETEYRSEPIPVDFMEELTRLFNGAADPRPAEIYLPRENRFLPSNLDIRQSPAASPDGFTTPELVRNDPKARVWWSGENFAVPKAYFTVMCRSPLVQGSAEYLLKLDLFTRLVDDYLLDIAYEASQVDFSYEVSEDTRGMFIYVNGYNSRLGDLLELIITSIRDFDIREDRFQIVKDNATDSYRNYELMKPYHQGVNYTWWLTTETYISLKDRAVLLPDIDVEAMRSFKHEFLSQLHIEAYAHGNLDTKEALRLTAIVESALKPSILSFDKWPAKKSFAFPPGSRYRFEAEVNDPKEVNNAIIHWSFLGERDDIAVRARIRLLDQMINKVAFDWLRTKLQLGYVVWAGSWKTYTASCFGMYIQGDKSCEYMDICATAFLKTYAKWLEKMDDDAFEKVKRNVVTEVLKKPKNLYQAYKRVWSEIDIELYNFEQAQQNAAHIAALTKADMVAFYQRYINPLSSESAQLSIHVKSQVKADPSDTTKDTAAPTRPGTGMEIEEIRKHLETKLKVTEEQLDDGVDLWREIGAQSQNMQDPAADKSGARPVVKITGKSDLTAILPSIDRKRSYPPTEVALL